MRPPELVAGAAAVLAVAALAALLLAGGAAAAAAPFPAALTLERAVPHKGVPVEHLKARDGARHAGRGLLGGTPAVAGVVDFPVEGSANPYMVGLYFTRVKLGNPAKEYFVQIDTGSDILWVACSPCTGCPTSSGLNIQLEFFNPDTSSTSSKIPCSDDRCTAALQTGEAVCQSLLVCPEVLAMAQRRQEENTSCVKPIEEEDQEEEEHQRGEWPLLSVCAQEQDAKPSFSAKSSSMRSIAEQEASGSGIRSLSFSKLFSFRIAKGASLDIDELGAPGDDADARAKKEEEEQQQQQWKQQPVCRSQSLPMTSIRRFPPSCKKRVADSSSLPRFRVSVRPEKESEAQAQEAAAAGAEEEEVGEEEAVCRICMVALWEGSVLKLECRCKGELALAHRDCALKWFRIKGNANCDVCSHDVLNLPVTLRRIHASPDIAAAATNAADPDSNTSQGGGGLSLWQHGTPILVIVSMLAYFCFLEQLLVGDHGTAALAISLPFAGVLGLFSSLTITKMVSRRYVWIYSAVQFLFIVLFTHLFYRYVRMQAVIAIILSTFVGFSVAICANVVLLQIIRWRARRPPPSDLDIAHP